MAYSDTVIIFTKTVMMILNWSIVYKVASSLFSEIIEELAKFHLKVFALPSGINSAIVFIYLIRQLFIRHCTYVKVNENPWSLTL